MKANELMIGNYVNEEVIGNCKVSKINKKSLWIEGNNVKTDGTENIVEYHLIYDYVKPIPLTEEWLSKLGFIFPQGEYCKKDDWTIVVDCDPFHIHKLGEKDSVHFEGFNIKYVHQLQNLYFALTGEELKITNNVKT